MKYPKFLPLIFIILFIGNYGCKKQKEPKDKFYANTGGWGEMRVPLEKPLYLFCYDGENWCVAEILGSDYDRNDFSITAIKKLIHLEDLFLFRSYGWEVYIKGKEYYGGWFILDTKKKTIDGYPDYKVFQDSLYTRYAITKVDTLTWRTPKSYFKEFKKERFLPWFPDSGK